MIFNPYAYAGIPPPPPSPFPIVADADTKTGTQSSSGTWTLDYPTNLANGDLILAWLINTGWNWPNNPGVFTVLLNRYGPNPNRVLIGKISDGTETGTFNIGWDGGGSGVWRCVRIPKDTWYGGGFAVNNPSINSDGIYANYVGSLDPTAITTPWSAADNLWIAVGGFSGSSTAVFTSYPTNYDNTASNSGGNAGLAIARRELHANNDDPSAFTLDTGSGSSFLVAIRPAP